MEDWERVALNERCRILEDRLNLIQRKLADLVAELERTKVLLEIKAENELARMPGFDPEGEYLPVEKAV